MVITLTRWTVADYHHMIASGLLAGRRIELVNGQIVDMAPELPIHRATYRRGVKYKVNTPQLRNSYQAPSLP